MTKAFLSLLIFTSFFLGQKMIVNAQNITEYSFEIAGKINADTGELSLVPLFYEGYYPKNVKTIRTKVVNQQFHIDGKLPYPTAFYLIYANQYRSRPIVIEPGTQTIQLDLEQPGNEPEVDNQAMREQQELYDPVFQELKAKSEALKQKHKQLLQQHDSNLPDDLALEIEGEYKSLYAEQDDRLKEYIKEHPDSYLALWKLVNLFGFAGYESAYDSAFSYFSDSLKSNFTAQALGQQLEAASILGKGKVFPEIKMVDTNLQKAQALALPKLRKNRYTFIDFWYSNCAPCIAQFPHLRETYQKYADQGFEIIGISTDRVSYQDQWLNAIDRFELSWPQYWDKDGKESSTLSIYKFPTNYLLDGEGKIIAKDLRPVELERFLAEEFK